MGHFKELFIDYKSMTKEEIAAYQASLATNQGGSGVGSTTPTKPTWVYKKSFSAREREMWRLGRQDNPFVSYQKTHTYVMRYQSAFDLTVDNLGKVLGVEVVDMVYGDTDRRNLIQALRSIKRRRWLERQSEDNDQIEITDSDLPF